MTISHNRIEVMHGVNLDMLSSRDPSHYGNLNLTQLEAQISAWAKQAGLETSFFQTNHEGEFVEQLHRLPERADAAIINAGAWTHYSWAIRDALELSAIPAVEVHLSDVGAREQWRRSSVFEGLVIGVVSGKGPEGYREAIDLVCTQLGA